MGAHARLRRPLPHQIPPLLGHLRPLRRARTEHRRQQRHPDGEHDPWGRPLDETIVLVLPTWTYDGTGYTTTAGAELALASAARARDYRGCAELWDCWRRSGGWPCSAAAAIMMGL